MYMIYGKKYIDWVCSLYNDYKSQYKLDPKRLNNLICYIILERISNSDNYEMLNGLRVGEDRSLLSYEVFKHGQKIYEETDNLCQVTSEGYRPNIDDLDKFIIDFVLTYTADISTEQMTKNLMDKTSWSDETKYPYPYLLNFARSDKREQLYAKPKADESTFGG